MIQWFSGGCGEKWPWSFSSQERKIFFIFIRNLWIELTFLMLIVMQKILVRPIPYPLTFKYQLVHCSCTFYCYNAVKISTSPILLSLFKFLQNWNSCIKWFCLYVPLRIHWRLIFGNVICCSTLWLWVGYFIYFKFTHLCSFGRCF